MTTSTKAEQRAEIIAAFRAQGIEALHGKGGFFLKGEGWISFAAARKRTQVTVADNLKREGCRMTAYGDYAIVAAISGGLNG
jgi:hypothetical protein